ncbi:hypothetical protein ACJRO7_004066 [Eucalyptus globulus]|uniref:Chalcone-flavonone isomerase family protein n=1 Tax=Eucalyptus globulus TaxID=34317 RepID=A0ABD3IVW2_EUCGL
MSPSVVPPVDEIQVECFVFPPTVKPPGSGNTLFLSGAGVRGLEVDGKYVKYTAIGVYLEAKAVPILAAKWKGKTADELRDSIDFFRDVVTGPFEKLMHVSFITQLTGPQYTDKITENCIALWNCNGGHEQEEAEAIDELIEVFKDQTFPPGSSIFFTQLTSGSYVISFSDHDRIPETGIAVIDDNELAGTVLETIIGKKKNGVSPAARHCLACRLAQLMKENIQSNDKEGKNGKSEDFSS